MTPPSALLDRLGPLGYGAAGLGNLYREVPDDEAYAIVDTAWRGGIRYFDTAPHYGIGLSERRLGGALRGRPREEYVLSTKVGRRLRPSPERAGRLDDAGFAVPAAYARVWDLSPDGLRRSLEESLERLGLDRVDIAYLHDPEEADLERALRESLPALAALRDEGLLGAVGVGSKSVPALTAAVRTECCDLVMMAGRLTLLDHSGAPLTVLCERLGVGVVSVGVFNSGALAAPRPDPGLPFEYGPMPADRLAALERLHAVCGDFGVRVADAALQYGHRWPAVLNVTVGALSSTELEASVTGMGTVIDPDLWAALASAGLAPDPAVADGEH